MDFHRNLGYLDVNVIRYRRGISMSFTTVADGQETADFGEARVHGHELITQFKDADMRLRLAIETDNDADICLYGDRVDELFAQMLALNAQSCAEQNAVLRFMVDRFVVREDCSAEMRRAVCERLLAALPAG